ncbi:MAG: hypothetical protein JRH20_18690 [Deltaproteobacteria bacterium]|nr:hypothetical protein [Deltaproteobacteria bacterium]
MKVPEDAITKVVQAASEHMSEPEYISTQVDSLMGVQPSITQYVIAHQADLSVEGVVTTLFHVAMMHLSIIEATGSTPTKVGFPQLDMAATATPTLEDLAKDEPNLASYIATNLDLAGGESANKVAGKVLTHIAQALVSM